MCSSATAQDQFSALSSVLWMRRVEAKLIPTLKATMANPAPAICSGLISHSHNVRMAAYMGIFANNRTAEWGKRSFRAHQCLIWPPTLLAYIF